MQGKTKESMLKESQGDNKPPSDLTFPMWRQASNDMDIERMDIRIEDNHE